MELLLRRQPAMAATSRQVARGRSARPNESDARAIGRRGKIRLGCEGAALPSRRRRAIVSAQGIEGRDVARRDRSAARCPPRGAEGLVAAFAQRGGELRKRNQAALAGTPAKPVATPTPAAPNKSACGGDESLIGGDDLTAAASPSATPSGGEADLLGGGNGDLTTTATSPTPSPGATGNDDLTGGDLLTGGAAQIRRLRQRRPRSRQLNRRPRRNGLPQAVGIGRRTASLSTTGRSDTPIPSSSPGSPPRGNSPAGQRRRRRKPSFKRWPIRNRRACA